MVKIAAHVAFLILVRGSVQSVSGQISADLDVEAQRDANTGFFASDVRSSDTISTGDVEFFSTTVEKDDIQKDEISVENGHFSEYNGDSEVDSKVVTSPFTEVSESFTEVSHSSKESSPPFPGTSKSLEVEYSTPQKAVRSFPEVSLPFTDVSTVVSELPIFSTLSPFSSTYSSQIQTQTDTESAHTYTETVLPGSETESALKEFSSSQSLPFIPQTDLRTAIEPHSHKTPGEDIQTPISQSSISLLSETHRSIDTEVAPPTLSQESADPHTHENERTTNYSHSPALSGSKEIFLRDNTGQQEYSGSLLSSSPVAASEVSITSGLPGHIGGPVGGPVGGPNAKHDEEPNGGPNGGPNTKTNVQPNAKSNNIPNDTHPGNNDKQNLRSHTKPKTQPSAKKDYLNLSNNSRSQNEKSTGNRSDESRFLSFKEWKKLKDEAGSQLDAPDAKAAANLSKESSSISKTLKNSSSSSARSSSTKSVATFEDKDHGRVYKDKFNYASVDCAATIVKTNSDAKGASAILTEVKDSYLLNKCSTANKFIVIELCQDILVSSVVMGNFELFSSMFRMVKFSVSDRFPVTKGWHELGQFEASNIRDTQTFNIENPLIWARYLKIEIVSHYGNEFYCPISLVRVHGKTMMEEFKDTDQDHLSSQEDQTEVVPEELQNNSSSLDPRDDECKVVTPYLALNEFLKDLNSSANYCDVPLVHIDVPQTTITESSNNKPTQESIFQNIVKRLSLLETNATLSLLYVEEQSKLLSDAFYNLENRQVRKFENLLSHINATMYTQVLYLEKAVEKIKTDSRSLFKAQSSQSLGTINNLRKETQSFGREISFLRKVVIADTLIILSLLAYVIVTRETLTVEELTGRQKQPEEPKEKEPQSEIKPFSNRHNRSKARRRRK